MSAPVLTVGYGKRSIEELVSLLQQEHVEFLIDLRSKPVSRFNPSFSQDALSHVVRKAGIRYVFMGDSLGGRPPDPTCYEHGHVVYDRVREKQFYQAGIERLLSASAQGRRVCLLCSESKPEECHRSKLVGVSLVSSGIEVIHVGAHGERKSQAEVLALLESEQPSLFAESFRSRKAYRAANGNSNVPD